MSVKISLCCDMPFSPKQETLNFLRSSKQKKINKIERSTNILTLGTQKFITLLPGEKYCQYRNSIKFGYVY